MKRKLSLFLVLIILVSSVFSMSSINAVEGEIVKDYLAKDIVADYRVDYGKVTSYSSKDYVVSYTIDTDKSNSKELVVKFKNVGDKLFTIIPMLVAGGGYFTADTTISNLSKVSFDGGITFKEDGVFGIPIELAPNSEAIGYFTTDVEYDFTKVFNEKIVFCMVCPGKLNPTSPASMFVIKPEYVGKNVSIFGDWSIRVKKITLNKKKITLKLSKKKKKTYTLKAEVSPTNANNKKLKWTSSNKKVATVNSKGKVTAKKKGVTYIDVESTDNSWKYARCKVVVKK